MKETEALLDAPGFVACRAALELASQYCSPSLLNHSIRSYVWGAAYARAHDMDFDAELLYVSAVLHDISLTQAFDNHALPFETAGGHVVWAFTTGAGWPVERRQHAAEVVIKHMWDSVDPDEDREGYLLELATGFDISGRGKHFSDELCLEVLGRYPRLDLVTEFTDLFGAQAVRKPQCTAAAAVQNGLAQRLAQNPLNRLG
jgi:hypothetical protein